jgi:NAD(P)-dependent dehydrogenase (short-subunit alcohol dehydrogenase family)
MDSTTNEAAPRVALITGGGSGIGRATALRLAAAGMCVVVADIDAAGAEATVLALREAGGTGLARRTDVTRSDQVDALIAAAVAAFGRLDCAFNNAGIQEEHGRLLDCAEDVFDRTMAVNVKGVWSCMRAQIRQMLAQGGGGGAIVNTASVAGLRGAPSMAAYAASKHAVVGLTKTAAAEYANKGIRINAVCPGVIRTPMYERIAAADPRTAAIAQRMHPIGRIGEADEVAATVEWLFSDAASFVLGQTIAVDGGFTAS